MVSEKKNLPQSRVKLTITVSALQFRHGFETELSEVSKDVRIEGFRPGKAPAAQVITKIGRQRIEAGALDRALSEAYYEAIKEKELVPVEGPSVEVTSFTAPGEDALPTEKVATFTAEVDVLPTVELKQYKKIKIKQPKIEPVKDADIDEVVEYLLKQRATLKEADKDLKLANGMWADIAFDGSVDGVHREDMKTEHHPLMLGEGQLIPGFEEQLIGMKTGEEKTFPITFPKDYHASELAGKKAEFKVKVHEVKEVSLPELDDDFAVLLGQKNVAALRDSITENLEQERAHKREHEVEDLVITELLKQTKFDLPQSMVRQEEERILTDTKKQVEQMGLTWELYVEQMNRKEGEIEKEISQQAEKNVRIGLALGRVVQEEGITDRENAMRLALEKLVGYATA